MKGDSLTFKITNLGKQKYQIEITNKHNDKYSGIVKLSKKKVIKKTGPNLITSESGKK